jgi:hypothetical protein
VDPEVITLASIIRNGTPYMDRYFAQVEALADVLPDLRVVVGEGDHIDHTADLIRLLAPSYAEIIEVSHGGPRYGSIDHPERWDNIAKAVRRTLDAVGDYGQFLVWIEADLIWSVDAMLQLLSDAQKVSAAAPCVYADGSRRWYDTWGYRNNGAKFNGEAPYWHEPAERFEGLVRIDSCGSCFVVSNTMRESIDQWSGHWPYRAGGRLWLDPAVEVFHP